MTEASLRIFLFPEIPKVKNNLVGNRYGKLTVELLLGRGAMGHTLWLCRCECGVVVSVESNALRNNRVSCGCSKYEGAAEACRKNFTTHGATKNYTFDREYITWQSMKQRVKAPNKSNSHLYLHKGIKICNRWLNGEDDKTGYECFLLDMGKKPTPKHSIDRYPNKNGNYEPTNCRWATSKEQARNLSTNKMVTVEGVTMCLSEACEKYDVPYYRANKRLIMGWTGDSVFLHPKKVNGAG